MMKNSEKCERTMAAYEDVCRVISKISKGDSLGDYPLLNAVSQLQILLTEAFDVDPETVCKMYRDADAGKFGHYNN